MTFFRGISRRLRNDDLRSCISTKCLRLKPPRDFFFVWMVGRAFFAGKVQTVFSGFSIRRCFTIQTATPFLALHCLDICGLMRPRGPQPPASGGPPFAAARAVLRRLRPHFSAVRRLLGIFWQQKVRKTPAVMCLLFSCEKHEKFSPPSDDFLDAFPKKQPCCRVGFSSYYSSKVRNIRSDGAGFLCTFSRKVPKEGAHFTRLGERSLPAR